MGMDAYTFAPAAARVGRGEMASITNRNLVLVGQEVRVGLVGRGRTFEGRLGPAVVVAPR